MGEEVDLKKVERKAYSSYHEDGLIDIFAGFVILVFGISMFPKNDWASIMPAISIAVMLPIWIKAKRQFTIPRIGYVKFGPKTSGMMLIIGLTLIGVVVGLVFAFGFTSISTFRLTVIQYGMILTGLVGAIVGVLSAYSLGIRRFYAYASLTFAMFTFGYFVNIYSAYYIVTLGIVVLASGSLWLVRFIRKYPLPAGEKQNDEPQN